MQTRMGLGLGLGMTRGGGGAAPYLGQVATRSAVMNESFTNLNQVMSRTAHYARTDITSLQIALAAWNTSGTTEVLLAGNTTWTASVEYPVGVFTQITFGGSASITVAAGTTTLSDAAIVAIPDAAKFWIRVYQTSPAGIYMRSLPGSGSPETNARFAVSGIADQTMSGTIAIQDTFRGVPPVAIIAQTTQPSIFIIGDSRGIGQGDVTSGSTTYVEFGNIARSVAPARAYINVSVSASTLGSAISNRPRVLALAQYCSHVIGALGINDVSTGRTSPQIIADIQTLAGLIDLPARWCTLDPHTTSTDGWATTANQTVRATEAVRVAVNTAIRSGITGLDGHFDVASATETSLNSGVWKAPGFTADGLHGTTLAYQTVQNSGVVDPTVFTR